ncbi:MAG: glycosyltransferase family 2 protein [Chloroflexi bacterium]|nr:glycosyltransferase family 2 protein [Chloroflexota bacterium]
MINNSKDNHQPSISVVVPVYNGSETLALLTERLNAILPTIAQQYEIIYVNDGSQDDSWECITELCSRFQYVRGINLLRNFGQHNAILCGIRTAKNEIIVTMDDDLQHPPDQIPLLLEKLQQGFDVVYGIPRKMPHSFFRNLASWLIKRILALVMGIKTIKDISAFRAFRSRLITVFQDYRSPGVIIDVMLSWGTTRFSTVVVEEEPREIGKSNYTFRKLLKQVFLILTGFSTIPLRFASFLGFSFTIFGFGVLVYVLIVYFTQGSIPGFPFLASIISLFSGIQLWVLGILGEYLARIFDRSMDRPPYFIGEMIN